MHIRFFGGLVLAITLVPNGAAQAQRANEDALAQAEDAFGTSVGNERVGLYSGSDVRGFSPVTAGNIRFEDLYYDRAGSFTDRLHTGTTIRVGITAQDYLFPAPTGIAEYRIRPVGDEAVAATLLGYGTLGGGRLEVDAQLPIDGKRLGVAGGIGLYADELPAGNSGYYISLASALQWRPADKVEVRPFWSRIDGIDREAAPVFVTGSSGLPPRVERRRFLGPDWTDARSVSTNMGLITRADIGGWDAAIGLFRSIQEDRTGYVDIIQSLGGSEAQRLITSQPPRQQSSTSGEARIGRRLAEGDRLHRLTFALRGRDRGNEYGGGDTIDFGRQPFDAPLDAPKPDFSFGPETREEVRQWTPGVAYGLQWRGIGSLQLGAQWTDYSKRIFLPGGQTTRTQEQAWLFNAAGSLQIRPDLALYGSYARGLEESGVAPQTTVNRGEALPAIFTRQVDAGLRWVLPNAMRLVAGVFEIEKPYFAANESNRFVELGTVRHRGLELSLSGSPAPRLSVVAGAVVMEPRVTGQPVDRGEIGRRPVGQAGTILTLSANYDLPAIEGLAFTLAANHRGERFGDRLNQVTLPAVTTLEAGLRYRFLMGDIPALLRFRVTNLTNVYEWQVVSSGSYEVNAPRSFTLFLTMDL